MRVWCRECDTRTDIEIDEAAICCGSRKYREIWSETVKSTRLLLHKAGWFFRFWDTELKEDLDCCVRNGEEAVESRR